MSRLIVFLAAMPMLGACTLVNPTAEFGDGVDAGPTDSGSVDSGARDADPPGPDSSMPDAGTPDAGPMIDPSAPQLVATGWAHTCAVQDATVYCWGDNDHGQIGDGTTTDRSSPTEVSGIPGTVVEVSAMGFHSCALNDAGEIFCWGGNSNGQLGDGTTVDRTTATRAAPSIDDAVRVSVGGANTCAVRENGDVLCWGRGDAGGLGDGSMTDSSTPVVVSVISDPLDIDGSGGHFCVRTEDDNAACWGWNGYGQLGQPFTSDTDIVFTPVSPLGLSAIKEVTAGGRHTCVRTDSIVACWGWNMFEQLGTPGPDTESPVIVGGLPALPVAIAGGGSHTCAAMAGGDEVYCWGGNEFGQLGLGNKDPQVGPQRVSGFPSTVIELDSGDYHTCARLDTGVLACWGLNHQGQLGTGNTTESLTPRVIVIGG